MARPYTAFTTAHDRVVSAADLVAETGGVPPDDDAWRREGFDARAAEIAATLPSDARPVQVLLDMSGSNRNMCGPIVGYVDLMARALELAGVSFEVLGFTTASFKGGRSLADWKATGAPGTRRDNPGRLCDLLHVVFKDRVSGWTTAPADGIPSPAEALQALYRPGNLRENVDGEAIRWARSRLAPGEVASLVLLIDGTPMDEATLSFNAGDILQADRDATLDGLASEGVVVVLVDVHWRDGGLGRDAVPANLRSDPAAVALATLSRATTPKAARSAAC